jgi:hypothetical protein
LATPIYVFSFFVAESGNRSIFGHMTIDLDEWSDPSPENYLLLRKLMGSQGEVAELLGLTTATICLRERGKIAIKREAWLALVALARETLG